MLGLTQNFMLTASGLTPGDKYGASAEVEFADGTKGTDGFADQPVQSGGVIVFFATEASLKGHNNVGKPATLRWWLRPPGTGFNAPPVNDEVLESTI